MNEDTRKAIADFDIESPLTAKGSANPLPISSAPPRKISSAIRETVRPDGKISDKDFESRVKAFTPVCVKLFGFLDAGGEKFIRAAGREIAEEDQIDKIVEAVKIGDESAQSGGQALSRIIARRVQNEEILDYLILGAIFAEWSAGITIALVELKKIKNSPTHATVAHN
jgi:hypothetical protein